MSPAHPHDPHRRPRPWKRPIRHEPNLARAARRAPGATRPATAEGGVLAELAAGRPLERVAEAHGHTVAHVAGVRSFYDQIDLARAACDGTVCHFGGGDRMAEALSARGRVGVVRCLGHCYKAPACRVGDLVYDEDDRVGLMGWLEGGVGVPPVEVTASAIPRASLTDHPVALRRILHGPAPREQAFGVYDLPDADTILATLERSGLRGRGGAAFPTHFKWRAGQDTPGTEKFVVANGDEGDPGAYVDRLLLEDDPHAVLAGMLACARVVGAGRGFDCEVVPGGGAYVCGEETSILRSIEGLRGEPWPRPPYPTTAGLWGRPTVVQNVETLAMVPWIARHGADGGTKVICVSGAVARPVAYEVALGTPLDVLLTRGAGGPPKGRRWGMALVGGPMGRCLQAARFATPLSYDALPAMGHAGVVVLDDTVTPRALAEHLFSFARGESCGSCTPCRVGTAQLHRVRGEDALRRLLHTLQHGSLCGFGQAVPRPLLDLLADRPGEVAP